MIAKRLRETQYPTHLTPQNDRRTGRNLRKNSRPAAGNWLSGSAFPFGRKLSPKD
jgi:hypothetical protein